MRLIFVLLSFALLAAMPVLAQPATAPVPTVSAEGIREYQLDNGLKIVLFPDRSKPVTTVSVTYLVGSRHENYGETGMAHLLEHLVFKGTPTHRDIPGEMKKRGIRFNGTTWFDRTNYFSSFSTDPETLQWLLEMEADRMVNSFISRDDLDSEMTVVRNEMESGENSPFRVLLQRVMASAYEWHNYGNSTIGARSDVEDVPITRLQAFYRNYYQPDNAVLVVAGDFDPEATLTLVANSFGTLAKPARILQPTYTREPAQDGEHRVTVRRVGKTPYLALGYHIPAGRHPDSVALSVLGDILGHTPTGRLHQALVETGLATQVFNFGFAMDEPGYFIAFTEAPADADLDQLETAMVTQIEHAATITDEEVNEARQRLLNSFEVSMRDPNRIGVALSEAIAQGDWRLYLLQRDRLEDVTTDDVRRVAHTYFKPDNRTVGRFLPTEHAERVSITEAPSAAELLAGYVGREAIAAGEVFDPTPANIDARTQTFTLDNGAQLAVLAKSTRGQSVQLRITLRLGDEASLHGHALAANLLGEMLLRGAGERDRAAISRQLDTLKSSLHVSASGGVANVTVSAETDRSNLEALLPLIADVLQRPTLPESEFVQLKNQAITALRSQMSEPNAIAIRAMSRHFNRWPKGHPYYVGSFEEDLAALEAVSVNELHAFHQTFYGAGSASIAVLGDVDAEAVHAHMAQLFGQWTAAQPFTRIEMPYLAVRAIRDVIAVADKPNAVFFARQSVPVGQTHADYPALVLGNYILGGGALKSRLADRIRQREGLSYGVGSQFSASALDEAGAFSAYAIAAPENIAKVEAAFKEEITRMMADGIAQDEFDEALDGLLRARQTSRANDGELIGTLAENLYLGRTMHDIGKFEDDLKALTPERVRDTLARYLDLDAMSLFMAGDFAKINAGD